MRKQRRLQVVQQNERMPSYDVQLDTAINNLRSMCPNDWQMIINHIDAKASMTPGFCRSAPDSQIVRLACKNEAYSELHARLEGYYKRKEKEKE